MFQCCCGEDGGRDEHEGLPAVQRDREGGPDRDLGLPEADVAADQAVHRARRLQILLHRLDRALLVLGLAVRELRLEPFQPLAREIEGDARRSLAARIEPDQLAGELLHGFPRAALEQEPRLAAQLRERGPLRVGADVARDLADLLVRHVEAVLAAEGEEQVVARDSRDLLRLEAEQLPDAMVLVDDEVTGAQVGERLERPSQPGVAPGGALAEDLRVRQQDEAEVAPDEAAAGRRDGEVEPLVGREVVAVLQPTDLEPADQVGGAERVTPVRERDHDALPGADEGGELLLGLGEPAGGDRGALCLECVRLAAGEWIEQRGVAEWDRGERFLLPDPRDRLGLEHEVRFAVERRHEIGRDSELVTVVGQLGRDEVEPPLGSRVDRRPVKRT